MPLTVLSNSDVDRVLHSLTKEDIEQLQAQLADALHWYSTASDENDYCSEYQPERIQLKRKDGSTTLFMPSSSIDGQAVKVLNITPPDAQGLPSLDNLSIDTRHSSIISSPSGTSSPRGSVSTTTSTETPTTSTSSSSLANVPSNGSGTAPISDNAAPTIRGSLTLLDALGNTTALINASELTAFRTALASTLLLKKRHSVHDITIFGAGKQAYWHARLALLLRGPEIHHLNIVTRSFDSARSCLMRLYNPLPSDPNYTNPIGSKYNSKTKTTILTPSHTEYQRLLKEYVRAANVIFMCTPSTSPLFPASFLTNPEGRKKGRYIACVGSYKPHMIELHPDILRNAVAPHHEHRHLHKRQKEGGAVIVDTVSGCLKEAGEVVQAKLLPDQVVELGELFMLKREAMRRMEATGEKGKVEGGCCLQEDSGMKEWLTRGNVLYKSVGVGVMDVVVGQGVVDLAVQRGVGVRIEDF